MGYDAKTKKMALDLINNLNENTKNILMNDLTILFTVLEVWQDEKQYKAIVKFKNLLSDKDKMVLKLESIF